MARITYTYSYKNYPDCPEATKLSKFWCSPKHGGIIGIPVGFLLGLLGCLVYNANGHKMGVIDTVLMILGFAFLLFGAFIIPALFKRLRISDRYYEKKMGKPAN